MAIKPKEKSVKKTKSNRAALVKKLDAEFSIYIRTRNLVNGNAECFTCYKLDDWKKLQCGHFMSRKHYSTRWDEVNCQVQCVGCNVYRYGEQYKFGRRLNAVHGAGTSEALEQLSKEITKFSNWELEEMIEKYKIKNKLIAI
jgi:hypothetical protein